MKSNEEINLISDLGKVLPQSIEIEEAILGALMVENSSLDIVNSILTSEMFYKESHQLIFDAIKMLDKEQKNIDVLTVMEKLKSNGNLEKIGGALFLSDLTSNVFGSSHIEYHSLIVKEKYMRRELIFSAEKNKLQAYDETFDTDEVINLANRGIEKILDIWAGKSQDETIWNASEKSINQVYERVKAFHSNSYFGIDTGIFKLNKMINGWQKEKVIILAARPSVGKTSLAIHFAKKAAKKGSNVAIFSLEMGASEITDKMICAETGINFEDYMSGNLNDTQIRELENSVGIINTLPITISDNPRVTVDNISSKARLLKKQDKCDMVIIDYLQLITPDRSIKNRTREQEVSEISRLLKIHAKALKVPFIVLCQLNRDIEKRGVNARPMLSDLRESGSLEQDADIVIFINRPELHNDEAEKGLVELIIGKNRGGRLGTVQVKHNGTMNDFYDYAPNYNSNIPVNNYYEKEKPF